MSTTDIEIDATVRTDFGKGASRRLRRENMVPGILYGGEGEPEAIMFKHNEVQKNLSNDTFYSSILSLKVGGKERIRAILRDVQRHPFKQQVMHLDFQRVVAGAELTMSVPLHFINEDTCVGVKAGGVINHTENELSVICRARDLPEFIEVDMAALDIGDSIHISGLTLPEGVRSVDLSQGEPLDRAVAAVQAARIEMEEEVDTGEDEVAEGDVPAAADKSDDGKGDEGKEDS